MLELRPNCELCDKDLPPRAQDARICTYECTFCADCVDNILQNVCPNCGGGLTPRPIRPVIARRPLVSLRHHPASIIQIHTPYDRSEIEIFVQAVKAIPPVAR